MENKALLTLMFMVLVLVAQKPCFAWEGSLYEKSVIERGTLRGSLKEQMTGYVSYLAVLYENYLVDILLENPDPREQSVVGVLDYILYVLESIYAVSIIILGVFLLFVSLLPERRAMVKELLFWFVLGLIITPVFPQIVNIVFDLSSAITRDIISLYHGNVTGVFSESLDFPMNVFLSLNEYAFIVTLPFIIISLSIIMAPLVLFSIRYIVLLILLVLSPFTIILYSFPQTRVFGKGIISAIFLWTFLQVVEAIALAVMFSMVSLLSVMGSGVTFLAVLSGSLALIFIFMGTVSIKI